MTARNANVIDIASRRRTTATGVLPGKVITQERLKLGLELVREQMRLTQALREYSIALEQELLAGASVEPGELDFDRDVKVARRRTEQRPQGAAVR